MRQQGESIVNRCRRCDRPGAMYDRDVRQAHIARAQVLSCLVAIAPVDLHSHHCGTSMCPVRLGIGKRASFAQKHALARAPDVAAMR